MLDSGKGDIYAVVVCFWHYQLIVPFQYNADFEAQRCDGTLQYMKIFILTDLLI